MVLDALLEYHAANFWWLIPLSIWTLVWKGMGLWKSAKNKKLYWFLAILILNTAGILPIVYILFFQKKRK